MVLCPALVLVLGPALVLVPGAVLLVLPSLQFCGCARRVLSRPWSWIALHTGHSPILGP
jgi:hypothetical protein